MFSLEKIAIGSDHGGYELKEFLKEYLKKENINFIDVGTNSTDSVDYPIYGIKVAKEILNGNCDRGIVICGTGIGISIAANRFKGIRAALCTSVEMAKLSREHNNANILALGGRILSRELALSILKEWLYTPFDGGRHLKRIEMLDKEDI